MTNRHVVGLVFVTLGLVALLQSVNGRAQTRPPAPARPAPNACAFPTTMAATPEQTAWQIFVAANCPAPGGKLVWETWIEQLELYPASGTTTAAAAKPAKRLHGSPLARALAVQQRGAPQLSPSSECNPMGTKNPPPNLVKNPTICEEARLNPAAASFVTGKGYQVRSGQTAAAKAGTNIQFTTQGIEVKVDWIAGDQFVPAFTCANPPAGVYTETIDGKCYALAGMHVSSKLLPDWVWATFEPQSMVTNPNRCITFGACNDPWGSTPATSSGGAGGFTKQTPAVQALMTAARLAPAFNNYRMDGTQTTFGTAQSPTLLGNSVIEGENVGLTAGQSSCITCHSVSSIKNDGTDGITQLGTAKLVGPKYVVPAGWIGRDFVWSMSLACPNGSAPQQCK